MLKYKVAIRDSTMYDNFKILQKRILWIPVKKHALKDGPYVTTCMVRGGTKVGQGWSLPPVNFENSIVFTNAHAPLKRLFLHGAPPTPKPCVLKKKEIFLPPPTGHHSLLSTLTTWTWNWHTWGPRPQISSQRRKIIYFQSSSLDSSVKRH